MRSIKFEFSNGKLELDFLGVRTFERIILLNGQCYRFYNYTDNSMSVMFMFPLASRIMLK